MEAIILAGGLGTRLQTVVPHLPKALAPIQKTPFLTLLLTQLQNSHIFSKIILSLGFKSDQIMQYLNTLSSSIPIISLIEPSQLGTGGAILYALQEVKHSTFCVLNGDSYSDLCFQNFYQFHTERNAEISIACHKIQDTRRYGTIQYDKKLRVSNFIEKTNVLYPNNLKNRDFGKEVPQNFCLERATIAERQGASEDKNFEAKPTQTKTDSSSCLGIKVGAISRGIYFFEKQIFKGFSLKECSLEKDLFPIFIKKKMFAYPQSTTFIDIGTEETYYKAQQLLNPWVTK